MKELRRKDLAITEEEAITLLNKGSHDIVVGNCLLSINV